MLSFAQLYAKAQAVADGLRGRVAPGALVPLVFAPGLEFIAALLGCWLLRAVPVPFAPETFRRSPRDRHTLLQRLAAPCVLCDDSSAAHHLVACSIPLARISEVAHAADGDIAPPPALGPEDVALVQFTSGSTAAPRGVVITHGNVISNMEMIRKMFGHDRHSGVAGWAPFYHDQGLVGNILQPLYLGSRCVLFPPKIFVRDPLLWLEVISDYRIHTSGGPNFAYELCVARFNATRMRGVNLSSWQIAFNGAEPVQADTLARFSDCFAPYGFERHSMYPCYGLAEATLFASGAPGRRMPVLRQAAEPLRPASAEARMRVGCGRAPAGTELLIVDPDMRMPCPPHVTGEIWISGAHIAQGYWQDDAATVASFKARRADASDTEYLRTGDLGFVDETGEVFPTGRIKELVIQFGKNYAPHEIEQTIAASRPELDPQRGVVFSVDGVGREIVIAVHEVKREHRHAVPAADIVQAIRRQVAAVHGLTIHHVILAPPNTIPYTTSGKKMRTQVRAHYLAGALKTLASAAHETTGTDEALV